MTTNRASAVAAFAAAAKNYCQFVQSFSRGRPKHLYVRLEGLFAQLQHAILEVKLQWPTDDLADRDEPVRSRQKWSRIICKTVAPEASALEKYYEGLATAETRALHEADVTAAVMLWDDIASVRDELRAGFAFWRASGKRNRVEAVWQWRWSYENHWGHHLLRAMKTVHDIRYVLYRD